MLIHCERWRRRWSRKHNPSKWEGTKCMLYPTCSIYVWYDPPRHQLLVGVPVFAIPALYHTCQCGKQTHVMKSNKLFVAILVVTHLTMDEENKEIGWVEVGYWG